MGRGWDCSKAKVDTIQDKHSLLEEDFLNEASHFCFENK